MTPQDFNRTTFLRLAGVGLAAGGAGLPLGAAAAGGSAPPSAAGTPAQALELLRQGDARFAAGTGICGNLTARRAALTAGQSPFAVVLSCSDSRVPVEQIFDQEPGNIFGVRVAGNFVDAHGLGSIEYAVAALGAKLVLVLGHSKCGAVDATVNYVKNGTKQPGHIQDLVTAIEPAVKASKSKAGDWLVNAIAQNVAENVRRMSAESTIVGDAVAKGTVRVVGGVYDLQTGLVRFTA